MHSEVQSTLSGFQIGEFRDNDETIKVMLGEPSATRNLLSALDNVLPSISQRRKSQRSQRQFINMNLWTRLKWHNAIPVTERANPS